MRTISCLPLGQIAGVGGAALGFLGVASAGGDDLAALQEGVGNGDRFFQETAGIVAQVDDEAFQLVANLAGESVDLPLQPLGGLFVERGDADIAMSSPSVRARTERTRILSRTSVTSIGLSCPLRMIFKRILVLDGAAHFLDGLVEGETLHGFVVEIGNDVVGHDAGPWRPGCRRSATPP